MKNVGIVISFCLTVLSLLGVVLGMFGLLYPAAGLPLIIGSVFLFSANKKLLDKLTKRKSVDERFVKQYMGRLTVAAILGAVGLWFTSDGFELDVQNPPDRYAQFTSLLAVAVIFLVTTVVVWYLPRKQKLS